MADFKINNIYIFRDRNSKRVFKAKILDSTETTYVYENLDTGIKVGRLCRFDFEIYFEMIEDLGNENPILDIKNFKTTN